MTQPVEVACLRLDQRWSNECVSSDRSSPWQTGLDLALQANEENYLGLSVVGPHPLSPQMCEAIAFSTSAHPAHRRGDRRILPEPPLPEGHEPWPTARATMAGNPMCCCFMTCLPTSRGRLRHGRHAHRQSLTRPRPNEPYGPGDFPQAQIFSPSNCSAPTMIR